MDSALSACVSNDVTFDDVARLPAYAASDRRAAYAAVRTTSRGDIVGMHPSVLDVLATIDQIAASTCTVLVGGESGTGKELAVAALHDASPRRHAPLIAVNCGAIPEALIESELFGHAKGAFTGAHAARQGRVGAAEGGTLFLDEVGELSLAMQVKILRLLQQREYSPVGDTRVLKCNVRIVAATNRDLEAEVAKGTFREDLYYRLNVVQVNLPPLRERGDDVLILAQHFFRVCAERAGRTDIRGFAPETLAAISAHAWPGNVRALENAVERAVLLARGPWILPSDLPPRLRPVEVAPAPAATDSTPLPESGIDLRLAVQNYENDLIRQALTRTNGNKNRAAMLLGLNRTTLVEMLKRRAM